MNVQQYWNAPFANKNNARRKNEIIQEEELYDHQKRIYSILGPLFCTRGDNPKILALSNAKAVPNYQIYQPPIFKVPNCSI